MYTVLYPNGTWTYIYGPQHLDAIRTDMTTVDVAPDDVYAVCRQIPAGKVRVALCSDDDAYFAVLGASSAVPGTHAWGEQPTEQRARAADNPVHSVPSDRRRHALPPRGSGNPARVGAPARATGRRGRHLCAGGSTSLCVPGMRVASAGQGHADCAHPACVQRRV
jgi:hypothetical protein